MKICSLKHCVTQVSKSFTNFVEKYKSAYAFRLSQKNIGMSKENVNYIPLYMLEMLLNQEKESYYEGVK